MLFKSRGKVTNAKKIYVFQNIQVCVDRGLESICNRLYLVLVFSVSEAEDLISPERKVAK